MIVSNNNEDENGNRPRAIIRGNAIHQTNIYRVSGNLFGWKTNINIQAKSAGPSQQVR